MKKGSVAIYVLALMLVTAGYWAYISNESQTLQTVSMENQNTTDEHLGDATLVSNNELINEENEKNQDNEKEAEETDTSKEDEYFQESKLSRDTMRSEEHTSELQSQR